MQPAPPSARIVEALAAHSTLTLAYEDEHGVGACALRYAVRPGPLPELLFLSSPGTRHGRWLSGPRPHGAFTVQRDGQALDRITGLQGTGTCVLVRGAARVHALEVYAHTFPGMLDASAEVRAGVAASAVWRLRPDWLRLIDNARGFGHKEEWPGD